MTRLGADRIIVPPKRFETDLAKTGKTRTRSNPVLNPPSGMPVRLPRDVGALVLIVTTVETAPIPVEDNGPGSEQVVPGG